jgi:DHA2 family multidrug resistance protein-like MFS transporter
MIDVRLFRIRRFSVALVVNFLSIFVMVGYVLYLGQYMQLVLGMSPLDAGLLSVPAAAGFVVSSQLAPRLVQRFRPSRLVSGGLAVSAAGMLVLTTVSVESGLVAVVIASLLVSLGMGPVFGLTTEMVVGSAPEEAAGAASGISETAAELGGALGIAILGTIGVAIYRGGVTDGLPAGVPAELAAAAEDTLGGAAHVAAQLPEAAGAALIDAANTAFVSGLHLTSAVAAVITVGLSVLAAVALRQPAAATEPVAMPTPQPEPVPVPCAA